MRVPSTRTSVLSPISVPVTYANCPGATADCCSVAACRTVIDDIVTGGATGAGSAGVTGIVGVAGSAGAAFKTRIRLFPVSAIRTEPSASGQTSSGALSDAPFASPPSPENPRSPEPAAGVQVLVRSHDVDAVSTSIRDPEVARPVESNSVRFDEIDSRDGRNLGFISQLANTAGARLGEPNGTCGVDCNTRGRGQLQRKTYAISG